MEKGNFGRSYVLGVENVKKIVLHIRKLQSKGFTPARESVRVSIKKSEEISVHRSVGLDKVENYFKLLEQIMTEHQLFDKPSNVYNVDDTGLQLNNKPGQVVTVKSSKSVPIITSSEKGETISAVTRCNPEGSFLPKYCIIGIYCKEEWKDDSDAEALLHDDSDDEDQSNLDKICVGCGKDYGQTVKSDDWIQCSGTKNVSNFLNILVQNESATQSEEQLLQLIENDLSDIECLSDDDDEAKYGWEDSLEDNIDTSGARDG
ncbi:hypothetical protein QE152_g30143 [Popillia japonica]|uniref:Transposase n=1 Tax=Popillia japonica TaxID=7064 RepID=A0AAW1JFX8_POPJA